MTSEYQQKQKQWDKRRTQIVKMHREGKNMQQIGDKFGVTRQRIRAVLLKAGQITAGGA